MTKEQTNRICSVGMFVLSLTASVVPWTLAWIRGFDQPPPEDEGTAAHLFQLSIVLLVPVTLAFFATADWARPRQIAKRVTLPAILVMLSISALFYYERIYAPAHFGQTIGKRLQLSTTLTAETAEIAEIPGYPQ